MTVISFARGVPATECLPVEELADCARAAIEGDGDRSSATGRRRLRAAARVDRGAARRRSRACAGHERVAAGVPLPRAGSRGRGRACWSRRRRTTGRSGAPRRARRRGLDRPAVDDDGLDLDALEQELERGAARPSSTRSRPSRTRAGARCRSSAGSAWPSSRASTSCSCSRTTRTGSSASRASRCRRSSSSTAANTCIYASSFSKTVAPGAARRLLRAARPGSVGAVDELADRHYISPALLGQATVLEFFRRGLLRAEPRARRAPAAGAPRRDARRARARAAATARLEPARGRLLHLARPAGGHRRRCAARAGGREAGVTFVRARDFFRRREGGALSVRLAYSSVSPPEIEAGVELLALARAGACRRLRRRPSRPSRRAVAAAAGRAERGAGGARCSRPVERNVGHGSSPGRAQRPARRK